MASDPLADPQPEPEAVASPPPASQSLPDRVLATLSRMFGADLRAMAALRVVLGAVFLIDLLGRWPDLGIHYSDTGLLSREHLLDDLNRWRWSVYLFNGTTIFAHVLFAISAVVAIAVILGYRTRVAMVAMWVLVVSLQVRNPLVLSGADSYLRVLAFWAMFLPLGATWSIDARGASPPPSRWYASVASAALALQIGFVYFFTALLKSGEEWRSEFTALWYALGAEQLTTPLGSWLHQFPELLKVLTVITLAIEAIAPFLLISPWKPAPLRLVGVALVVGLQLGILLTMTIGIFPVLSAACMVWFLPTPVWDWLGQRLPRPRIHLPARLRQALVRIPFRPATGPSAPRTGLGTNLAVALLLVLVLGWNIDTVADYRMPSQARPVVYGLGLYQRWAMFAPTPPRSTQWSVVVGTLANGRQVSLLEPLVHDDMSGALPVTWTRPASIGSDYYGNKYWRKYFEAIDQDDEPMNRRLLAGYTCRHWNDLHVGGERLVTVQLYSVLEETLPDGATVEQRRIERSSYTCA